MITEVYKQTWLQKFTNKHDNRSLQTNMITEVYKQKWLQKFTNKNDYRTFFLNQLV